MRGRGVLSEPREASRDLRHNNRSSARVLATRRTLLNDLEILVAGQRAGGSRDDNGAGGRAAWYNGCQVRVGDDGKAGRWNTVESHGSCSGETLAENLRRLAHLANRKHKGDEGTKLAS